MTFINFLLNTVVSTSEMPSLPSFLFSEYLCYFIFYLSFCLPVSTPLKTFWRMKKGYSLI